jgi:hypothetical protein
MDDIVERLKPDANQLDALESHERLAAVMAQSPKPAHRGRMLLAAGGAAAVLAVGLTVAINSPDGGQASGDRAEGSRPVGGEGECQPRLRIDGVVYLGAGYLEDTDVAVTPAGRAELSDCNDEGPSPRGAYFPATPQTAPVFAFGGQSVDLVVAIEFPSGYEVYIAESVPTSRRDEILRNLTSAN